ncbi:RNA polymerase sigma factor [Cellulophaga sp. Hel_I_12]|uniref:RNA polymerase sigma factor n=1 Tax=Cellulophaga sp. Hel_I_12 TaxID=1249972 RepID=UPI000648ABBB|nr:sigma-70 family RNA polymerase sigma factor [Cellulophaga sp. Hel_I_12]
MQDKEQFEALILKHQGLVYKVARLYVDTPEDQSDLYQEIVYQLWKSISQFKGDAKISTWMYRVALNTAIAFLHQKKKRQHTTSSFELPEIIDDSSLEKEEQSKYLYKAIKQLSVVERGIVFLFLEGKSYREIATITGFSESNVGTRMLRIKKKLKELIPQ